jgi:hypothetical protein
MKQNASDRLAIELSRLLQRIYDYSKIDEAGLQFLTIHQ